MEVLLFHSGWEIIRACISLENFYNWENIYIKIKNSSLYTPIPIKKGRKNKPLRGVLEELPPVQNHPSLQGPLGLLCRSLHHCPCSQGLQELTLVEPWSGL